MTNEEANARRAIEANCYRDGVDMGIAHMCDALGAGKTMIEAVAYAKAMGECSAEHSAAPVGARFTIAQMKERRAAVCAAHGVERGAYDSRLNGCKLARS